MGIIADDLTGACDAGVEFVARGFSCVVPLDSTNEDFAEVRVISTETRASDPAEARSAVRKTCERLVGDGARVVYKKIDSTMRGNCRAEIDAAMEALDVKRAFVTPAFPEMDRQVASGWLSVGDDPSQSVFLPSVLGESGVHCLSSAAPYPDLSGKSGLFIVDASTREELSAFAHHYRDQLSESLVAGSGGLAAEIAGLLSAGRTKTQPITIPPARPLLFVVGSSHPNTLAQLDFLQERSNVPRIPLIPGWEGSARSLLRAGRDTILAFNAESISRLDLAGVRELAAQKYAAALVLSGGFTARIVCEALGVRAIRLRGSLLPGIPIGSIVGGIADGLPLITKSGGFGRPNLLDSVMQSLSGAAIQ